MWEIYGFLSLKQSKFAYLDDLGEYCWLGVTVLLEIIFSIKIHNSRTKKLEYEVLSDSDSFSGVEKKVKGLVIWAIQGGSIFGIV